jgi:hypothetical protein
MKCGRRAVIDQLREQMEAVQPKGGILALPYYGWRALYTTNYDFIIERAYAKAGVSLTTIASAYDFPLLERETCLPLYKIHGTLNQDRCYGHQASVILTEGDYSEHLKYRRHIFEKMKADLAFGGVLIVGHSLSDQHLREMIRDVAQMQKEIGRADRVSLLSFVRDEHLALVYEKQGIRVAFGGIEDLMDAFTERSPAGSDPTGGLVGSTQAISHELMACTIFVPDAITLQAKPEALFAGREASYADVASNLTFARIVEQDIISRVEARHVATVVAGPAGVGKSTAVRRAVYTLSNRGHLCWEHIAQFPLRVESWLAVESKLRIAGLKGILVLDTVTRNQRKANELVMALAKISDRALIVVATAETSQWKPRIKAPAFLENGNPLTLSSLRDSELVGLLDLVEQNPKIGRLATISFKSKRREAQLRDLRRRCGSDMFVCMKNMFAYDSFDIILLREYGELSEEHRDIYRHVSALHAAGIDVHRQLILRLLNIDVNSLAATLSALDGLVEEVDHSTYHGIYVWRLRHRAIAEIITRYKFADADEFSELIKRVANCINPAFHIELRSVNELCNSDFGIKAVRDPATRLELYQILIDTAPTERVPRHRLIKELIDQGDVDSADVAIALAIQEVHLDPPLHRYRILSILHRARKDGLLFEDRKALLQRAHDEAVSGIAMYPDSKYSYFVTDEVARDYFELTGDRAWLNESQSFLEKAYQNLLDPDLALALRNSRNL